MGNRVVYLPAYEAEVEYLESTGTQWIDTGVKPDNTYTFDCEVAVTQDNYNCIYWGTRNSGNSMSENNQCYLNSNGVYPGTDYSAIHLYSTNKDVSSNWSSNITPSINTMYEFTGMTVVSTMNPMIYPITLFAFNMIGDINAEVGKCRIGYWKCYSNGQIVRDFIPVRIGTTGYMYDNVSRQLFANAGTGRFVLGNDVANATVPQLRHVVYFGGQRCVGFEKVYEKCAWLKGRNGAYIDTDYIPLHSDSISCHYRYDGVTKNPDDEEQEIFGLYEKVSDDTIYRCRAYINSFNRLAVQFCLITDGFYETGEHITDADITDLHIEGENFYFRVNGVQFSYPTNLDGTTMVFSKSLWIFSYNVNKKRYFHGDIAYFRIADPTSTTDRINMFPCRLLVDIPAILDGNGIARQAGTCGMWDTVSGRFFGNVADRGTFDVVYFEEGVDYEVHSLLVTSVNEGATLPSNVAYITIPTPILLDNKVLTVTMGSVYRDLGIYGSIVEERMYAILAYTYGSGSTSIQERYGNNIIHSITDNLSGTKTITLDFKNKVATVGNNSFNIDGVGYQFRGTSANSWGRTKTIGNITIDNELNLIPVKLLRSIPSKYDANGIARNAGECGMYDTINDLFYGNVASRGVFSVSDD
jgi:hypothetical protein